MSLSIDHQWTGAGPESYWEPRHRVASAWREHSPFAYWLISAIRPQLIVELGTHNGFSFFVFAEAVKRLGLKSKLFAIDSWQGDFQAGFYDESVYESVREISQKEYSDSTTLIRAYFSEAVLQFEDGSIDLLHIDGRHGYDDVREDFEAYEPKLSTSAVVLFHDTQVFDESFGVHRFWAELRERAPSFEFLHGHGLGILAFGHTIPEPVAQLIALDIDSQAVLRRFYEARGAEISALYATAEHTATLELENSNLRDELAKYNDVVLDRDRRIDLLWNEVREFRNTTA